MKKALVLIAASAALLALFSCEKENIDGRGDSSSSPSTSDVFYSVVSQLVNKNELVGDYSKKTFQPTIGIADGGDESVRVVATNSLEAAVNRYNTLTGASIDTNTVSHTFSDKAVGTLTWSKNTDNKAFGTVTASIPSVPTLQKIIYRAGDQGDVNGSFGVNGKATAYYRFGDVVKRTRKEDGVVEYWVCVRPAFTYEEKEKSHWISVSPLPKDKLWEYYDTGKPFTASNNMDYSLPWKIGTDLEWHQDLAEMLFAIMYPEEWATNIQNYSSLSMFGRPSGLPIFNDFHCSKIKYHNVEFWKSVQNKWKKEDVVRKVFGISYDEMAAAIKQDDPNARGLHFLYDGSDWSTRFSNKPTLYEVHFGHGTKDTEKNMHLKTKSKKSAQVVTPKDQNPSNKNYPLDIRDLSDDIPYLVNQNFFGDTHPRWIVRYAEGDELSQNGKFSAQLPIKGYENGEVYRFYHDVYPKKNLTDAPEVTVKGGGAGYVGRAHYRWGNVYEDETGAKWFVINHSGIDTGLEDDPSSERSIYSELISIDPDGFSVSSDNGRVNNLPTLEQTLRVYGFLFLTNMLSMKFDTYESLSSDLGYGYTVKHVLDETGFDFRKIFQALWPQDGVARHSTMACSIAYDKPGTKQQALLRCIMNIQNSEQNSKMYFWTKYPQNPDLVTQFVTKFSPVSIYLQDIADQEMVNKYAKDTYAVQPLATILDPSSDVTKPRSIRTQADNRATDVHNYFYDPYQFNHLTYPGDMWNEPILFFRYTRVRDMGDDDYDTKTVDGHTLSLVSERPWVSGGDDLYEEQGSSYAALLWHTVDYMYVDGVKTDFPKWDDLDNSGFKSK